jgi:maltoporin
MSNRRTRGFEGVVWAALLSVASQQPFQAPLAGSKYRLGNEAETYLETVLAYGAASEGERPAYFDRPGESLVKVTIAPQITPAFKFLNRPSLRAFATWAHWSDTFRGGVAPATNPDAVHGIAVGVQMETWW